MQEFGIAIVGERAEAEHDRQAERERVVEEAVDLVGIVDRLSHHHFGAGVALHREAAQLAVVVERGGLGAGGEHEAGRGRHLAAGGVDGMVEATGDVEQADAVDVVDRGGMGVGSHLGRVAGNDDKVAHAERVHAEQMGLQAEQVSVAAADMHDRLYAGRALDLEGHREV